MPSVNVPTACAPFVESIRKAIANKNQAQSGFHPTKGPVPTGGENAILADEVKLANQNIAQLHGQFNQCMHQHIAPTKYETSFDPSKHGFKFPNAFSVDKALSGIPGLGKSIMGLCGGMCLGALSRFSEKRAVPDLTLPHSRLAQIAIYTGNSWGGRYVPCYPLHGQRFYCGNFRQNNPQQSKFPYLAILQSSRLTQRARSILLDI